MVVFNGFTSVPALKSCAIDTDLGTTFGVVTRNGVAGADLGRAGVCSNDASKGLKYAIGVTQLSLVSSNKTKKEI